MRGALSTAQKGNNQDQSLNDQEECEVSAFELKTPGKTNLSKEVNKVMTRSQKKRGKRAINNATLSTKRRRQD